MNGRQTRTSMGAGGSGWEKVRNRSVAMVWAAGLGVAALVYAVGPDNALAALFNLADSLAEATRRLVQVLGGRAADVLRALAIGCFATFLALCVVATGRGRPAGWLMACVSLLFVLLVWHQGAQATAHWLLAFLLSAAAALHVTRRLDDRQPGAV